MTKANVHDDCVDNQTLKARHIIISHNVHIKLCPLNNMSTELCTFAYVPIQA